MSLGPPLAEGKGEGVRPLIVEAGLVPRLVLKGLFQQMAQFPLVFVVQTITDKPEREGEKE